MVRSGTLPVAGGAISFEVKGTGPPVVLVHGFTLDRRQWIPQTARISRQFQVVTYDCRGFGRSSTPVNPYSHAEDLRLLLAHLDIASAHIIGSSMGGRIAIGMALRWPELVRSLAVIGTDVGGFPSRVDWSIQVGSLGLAAAREAWLNHEIFDSIRGRPNVWRLVRLMVGDYSGWHWANHDRRLPPDTGDIHRLAEVQARTTVVVGEWDLPDFHMTSDAVAGQVSGAQRVEVPAVGHLVNLELPDICTDVLIEHLEADRGS